MLQKVGLSDAALCSPATLRQLATADSGYIVCPCSDRECRQCAVYSSVCNCLNAVQCNSSFIGHGIYFEPMAVVDLKQNLDLMFVLINRW